MLSAQSNFKFVSLINTNKRNISMRYYLAIILTAIITNFSSAQYSESYSDYKWGVEFYALWPIFPGDLYKIQGTYEAWRENQLAGDIFLGLHIHPTTFREDEGDFGNAALTFGYRQFIYDGIHIEFYNAFGPGWNRNNAIDGQDYDSWDYEIGLLGGYRWEFLSKSTTDDLGFSPYLSTQHGVFYLAHQSNPHPIRNSEGEAPIYVGTLNIGIKF